MKKVKGTHEIQDELKINNTEQEGKSGVKTNGSESEEKKDEKIDALKQEFETVKSQLADKVRQSDEYLGMLQRTAAEFDNYKKRTAREKESLYSDAMSDVVLAFLPVIDNLERALKVAVITEDTGKLKDGVDLVVRQINDVLKNLGVEEVKSVGENFDPLLHNAVMHITDDSLGENVIVEEFQKGYIFKEKVIRHSMVKVAN